MFTEPLSRRAALATAARTLMVGFTGAMVTELAAAPVHAAPAPAKPPDQWLTKLNVRHKMLFDSSEASGGVGLAHLQNYYETYNQSYGVPDADIRGVFTFYGATTAYGLNDAMWAKYRMGEFLSTEDPFTGSPALANPWRANLMYRGRPFPEASIEALQKRGAIFLLCDYALVNHAGRLARTNSLDAKGVYDELKANVLHGVEVVPSMIVSIEQAHRAGLAYQRK